MRLLDLDPAWLMFERRRVGLIFRSPLPEKRHWWQTCFVECFASFKGTGAMCGGGKYGTVDSQCGIVDASAPQAKGQWQGCKPDIAWTVAGGIEAATFESISITPSLDGSAGGLWHGFITNGAIT